MNICVLTKVVIFSLFKSKYFQGVLIAVNWEDYLEEIDKPVSLRCSILSVDLKVNNFLLYAEVQWLAHTRNFNVVKDSGQIYALSFYFISVTRKPVMLGTLWGVGLGL